MLKWYGRIYSTAIPSNYSGAVVFKIKKQTVVAFKCHKPLKEFAQKWNGFFDDITQLWVIPVSDTKEIGIAIKSFEQDFPEVSYLQVACDGMPESVEKSLSAWIEKRNANSPKPPESLVSKIMSELRSHKIKCTRQDVAGGTTRIFIDYQAKISDEESIEINLSDEDIKTIKSLGFKKDGALWEIRV